METKLTLRMDARIIDDAKNHARRQGISLSRLVADYLQMLAGKRASASIFKPTPILSEITGVLQKNSGKKDLRHEYYQYLEEKYL